MHLRSDESDWTRPCLRSHDPTSHCCMPRSELQTTLQMQSTLHQARPLLPARLACSEPSMISSLPLQRRPPTQQRWLEAVSECTRTPAVGAAAEVSISSVAPV